MSAPLDAPVLGEVSEVLASLDEITEAAAMAAARIAYAKGHEDGAAVREPEVKS